MEMLYVFERSMSNPFEAVSLHIRQPARLCFRKLSGGFPEGRASLSVSRSHVVCAVHSIDMSEPSGVFSRQ